MPFKMHKIIFFPEIVSEYDQEMPQSQTADKPMAPLGRATLQSRDTIGLELAIDPPPPGGILYTMIF